jgi:hypothetical protein
LLAFICRSLLLDIVLLLVSLGMLALVTVLGIAIVRPCQKVRTGNI